MTPDRQPLALDVRRVEWLPSTPDALEVRVFGAWEGATVPPAVSLLVGEGSFAALPGAPGVGAPPAWSAAFRAPVEVRAALEAGEAALEAGGVRLALPPALPGALGPVEDEEAGGTLVDPAVLAERRARRAELAEQSASERAATAEQTVDTLRAQLGHLEERLAGAAADRDRLSARVADAERRLRLAEQREEAERRRRAELEEETLAVRRGVEAELTELRDRLAGAEEVTAAIEKELLQARRRQAEAERRAADADALRARLADAESGGGELEALRARLADAEERASEAAALRARLAAAEERASEAQALRARLADADERASEAEALRARLADADERASEAESLRARLAAAEGAGSPQEEALTAEVARLEAELAQRAAAQDRVHDAVAAVRDELARVRTQVEAGQGGGAAARAEVAALDDRRRALEATLVRRDADLAELRAALDQARATVAAARAEAGEQRAALVAAHRTVSDLQARLEDERRHRAAAEAELAKLRADAGAERRAQLEARLHDLAGEIAAIRGRLREATADLEARLAEERRRREDAEARLAVAERPVTPLHAPEVGPDVDPDTAPDLPPETGPDALPDVGAPDAPLGPDVDPDVGDPDAPMRPDVDPDPPLDAAAFPSTGDGALDALIAGLRAQVASARKQLDTWDADPAEAAPAPGGSALSPAEPPRAPLVARDPAAEPEAGPPIDEATRQRLAAIEAELRAAVPDPSAPTPARDVIASLQHAADRLRTAAEEELDRLEAEDAASPPGGRAATSAGGPAATSAGGPAATSPGGPAATSPGGPAATSPGGPAATSPGGPAATSPGGPAATSAGGPATTAAAPESASPASPSAPSARRGPEPADPLAAGPGAVRLSGALAAHGAALEGRAAAAGQVDRREGRPASHEVDTPVVLGARETAPGRERTWLRAGLERLVGTDPHMAADLAVALLPAQALVADRLTYDLAAPELGLVRVTLHDATAHVDRPPMEHAPPPDATVSGELRALVPLAAGGASWRLPDLAVSGSALKLRRLAFARRRPVTLDDLRKVTPPPDPRLLLAALAAAVDPAWTAGHRFGVTYAFAGNGRWAVLARGGDPLIVLRDEPQSIEREATISAGPSGLLALLAGGDPAAHQPATLTGDRRCADLLHAWFDRARGASAR